jgi:hypothetical protein
MRDNQETILPDINLSQTQVSRLSMTMISPNRVQEENPLASMIPTR